MDPRAYLVNAAIAAALGAGTNELAIVAILRYVLPRKKSEIARRIRDLIATDLISPEKMRQKLDEPGVGRLLEHSIDDALASLLARNLPEPDALLADHLGSFDQMLDGAIEALLDEFSCRVAAPDFPEKVVRPFLAERWDALRSRTPRSLMTAQADRVPGFVASWITSLPGSEPLRESVRRSVDRWLARRIAAATSASDLLTPGLVTAAEDLAVSQAPAIIGQLMDILREPTVQNTIADGIMESIWSQLRGQGVMGGIKGVFVSAMNIRRDIDGICRRLPDALEASFRQPLNRDHLAAALRFAVRKGFARGLDDDLRTPEKRAALVDLLLGALWRDDIFRKAADKAERFVTDAFGRSLEDTLLTLGAEDSVDAILDEATARVRRILVHPATRGLAADQLRELAAAWRTRPLGRLDRFIGDDTRQRVAAAATREALEMLRGRLEELTEQSGLWDIVVASIEAYDDAELAAMIRQLARSELRWITVLGGCIGAVVGVLQTFLYARGWL
ncbi:MAG: DUF445 domain-containing protein [Planctomycetaceae bacterium]|nr:DUF445 domain-containing protein [Planctomycetaceae bacterium]